MAVAHASGVAANLTKGVLSPWSIRSLSSGRALLGLGIGSGVLAERVGMWWAVGQIDFLRPSRITVHILIVIRLIVKIQVVRLRESSVSLRVAVRWWATAWVLPLTVTVVRARDEGVARHPVLRKLGRAVG